MKATEVRRSIAYLTERGLWSVGFSTNLELQFPVYAGSCFLLYVARTTSRSALPRNMRTAQACFH
jgi:hypothetical protein